VGEGKKSYLARQIKHAPAGPSPQFSVKAWKVFLRPEEAVPSVRRGHVRLEYESHRVPGYR
jgi:hypothetical protein